MLNPDLRKKYTQYYEEINIFLEDSISNSFPKSILNESRADWVSDPLLQHLAFLPKNEKLIKSDLNALSVAKNSCEKYIHDYEHHYDNFFNYSSFGCGSKCVVS